MTARSASTGSAEALHPVVLHHIVNTLGWPALRPLQEAAVAPVLTGHDALLLAPTAGGKTEAAFFPLLTRLADQTDRGVTILYLCPLKALLNNVLPRLESYASWIGRRAALWHGDVKAAGRKTILTDPPDILLTTPESLEAMLVSVKLDHHRFFANVRTVVVDEVHAFAGDDRGWHMLAVLERLTRIAGRPIQRIGLSATVGNPSELLTWLQGSSADKQPAQVVAPELAAAPTTSHTAQQPSADIALDYVGSIANAATVIAKLHRGEKRLVFCDSKRAVEELGQALREREITTFLSHASLSADERRRSEQAFAEARDCVIVSTSTLELGIDVGDLDRVIQINAPTTVASFLQRLGRTGRRPGSTRNCLFLAVDDESLVRAAALLSLWGRGWVEPIVPPQEPRQIAAQQLLALCLQEGRVGDRLWAHWWNGLPGFGTDSEPIIRHLVESGFLDSDEGMLFIGPEAERRYGRRHFMELTAVFLSAPEFTVLAGRTEIGRTDPTLLTDQVEGPRRLLLAGRTWQVTHIDWHRRRCFVEPTEGRGRARWQTFGFGALSYEMTRAMRDVLLGTDPPVRLTERARTRMAAVRGEAIDTVHPAAAVITTENTGEHRWWTWAGLKANLTLASTLAGVADPVQAGEGAYVRLASDVTPQTWRTAVADALETLTLPDVNPKALRGLKFTEALPERLAIATLAARLADLEGAAAALREPIRFER